MATSTSNAVNKRSCITITTPPDSRHTSMRSCRKLASSGVCNVPKVRLKKSGFTRRLSMVASQLHIIASSEQLAIVMMEIFRLLVVTQRNISRDPQSASLMGSASCAQTW